MFFKLSFVILYIASIINTSQQDEVDDSLLDDSHFCVVPRFRTPDIYIVDGIPVRTNSDRYHSFFITVECPEGFRLYGKKVVKCVKGEYLEPRGRCMVITNDENGDESKTGTGSRPFCEVPDRPKHGSYVLRGKAHPEITGAYYEINVMLKCNVGYELKGQSYSGCFNGTWFSEFSTCVSKYGYLVDPLERGALRSQPHCKPPETPQHGSYVINGDRNPSVQDAYLKMYVTVTCNQGYQIQGEDSIRCEGGKWSAAMPICGLPCNLKKDPRVDYLCEHKGALKPCGDYVRPGEIVTPSCKDNITRDDITVMRCSDKGYFDHVVTCAQEDMATECGLVTVSDGLIIGGISTEQGEVPWHAGVYTKATKHYMQICGGTIVTSTSIISAAHCFWSDDATTKPASSYAVAVGKIYRPWNNPHDIHAQKFDVLEIKIPLLYFGSSANYQNDIAVLKLDSAIDFNRFVRPICLDFTEDADRSQPADEFMKVAGWGLVSEEGEPSQVLKAVFLPIVEPGKCAKESPLAFKPYITPDKICAGYKNGTAVCRGDSGGGLASHRTENGIHRYYLHGVVSTAPNYGLQLCNAFTWATFTSITKHKGFVYSNIK